MRVCSADDGRGLARRDDDNCVLVFGSTFAGAYLLESAEVVVCVCEERDDAFDVDVI